MKKNVCGNERMLVYVCASGASITHILLWVIFLFFLWSRCGSEFKCCGLWDLQYWSWKLIRFSVKGLNIKDTDFSPYCHFKPELLSFLCGTQKKEKRISCSIRVSVLFWAPCLKAFFKMYFLCFTEERSHILLLHCECLNELFIL